MQTIQLVRTYPFFNVHCVFCFSRNFYLTFLISFAKTCRTLNAYLKLYFSFINSRIIRISENYVKWKLQPAVTISYSYSHIPQFSVIKVMMTFFLMATVKWKIRTKFLSRQQQQQQLQQKQKLTLCTNKKLKKDTFNVLWNSQENICKFLTKIK